MDWGLTAVCMNAVTGIVKKNLIHTSSPDENEQKNLIKKRRFDNMNSDSFAFPKMSESDNSSPDIFASCSPMEKADPPDNRLEVESDDICDRTEGSIFCEQSKPADICMKQSSYVVPTPSPVEPSYFHTVFYEVPYSREVPKPYPPLQHARDSWDRDHVRMPFSHQNLYPVQEDGDERIIRKRWELVQEALLKTIVSSHQLETAILSYNSKYSGQWKFSILHKLFEEEFGEDEVDNFFSTLLPKIIQLALQLPTLLTTSVPLLVQHRNHTLSFTQLQIASLLANAFLCTFPRRNTTKRQSEYARYPDINFNRLYQPPDRSMTKMEKLKCLLHYFRRVCTKVPDGIVSYSRCYLSTEKLPCWERSEKPLSRLDVRSQGTIEENGAGMLQVDFANKLVGGGVLGRGCVQEEIRFAICPELIAARLFTEGLDSTEALIIVGCEQFSKYEGYGDTFKWKGDFQDSTPRDSSGRRMCTIVAIDAIKLGKKSEQYNQDNLLRELNKAYAGFCRHRWLGEGDRLAGVASGNWGCGAFGGDARLKSLLQLMAASQAGRNLTYFTFGDTTLRDELLHIYKQFTEHQVSVGQLWYLLCRYYSECIKQGNLATPLYSFLHQALSKQKPQVCMKFKKCNTKPVDKPRSQGVHNGEQSSGKRRPLTEEEITELLVKSDSEMSVTDFSTSEMEFSASRNRSKQCEVKQPSVLDLLQMDSCNENSSEKDRQTNQETGNTSERSSYQEQSCRMLTENSRDKGQSSGIVTESCKALNENFRGTVEEERCRTVSTGNEKKRVSNANPFQKYFQDTQSSSSVKTTSSPVAKRKISDYFSPIPGGK